MDIAAIQKTIEKIVFNMRQLSQQVTQFAGAIAGNSPLRSVVAYAVTRRGMANRLVFVSAFLISIGVKLTIPRQPGISPDENHWILEPRDIAARHVAVLEYTGRRLRR
ncbi:MAG: hypothetical protein HY848_07205 [Betaproteobacteria bacterium]|nr:hypothetical protein [Betaproteobacteria bacterium]